MIFNENTKPNIAQKVAPHMTNKILYLALAITFFFSTQLAADDTAVVNDIVRKAKEECTAMDNGEFSTTEQTITLHDFTGDGRPEELVDAAQFSCSTAVSLWGGTGGTYLWVVVDGEAHEFLAHQWKVVDVEGQNVLLLAVHSSECSDDIGPCFRAHVWDDGFRTTR